MTDMTDRPSTTDVLLKAADLLGERGWCQGISINSKGQLCAVGAIRTASEKLWWGGDEPVDLDFYEDIEIGIGVVHSSEDAMNRLSANIDHKGPIPGWNDEPERTAEDVILAMKRAAHSG